MKLRLLTNLFPPRSSINFFLGNDHSRIWLLIWNIHSCKFATLQARGLEGWGDFKTSTSKNSIFLQKFWVKNFTSINIFIVQELGFSKKLRTKIILNPVFNIKNWLFLKNWRWQFSRSWTLAYYFNFLFNILNGLVCTSYVRYLLAVKLLHCNDSH